MPHHLSLELKAVRQNSPVWEAVKGGIHGYVIRFGLHSQYSLLNVKGDADSYWSSLGNMRRMSGDTGRSLKAVDRLRSR